MTLQELTPFLRAFFLVYAGLFPIINPISDAPVFMILTRWCTPTQRHELARQIAVNSFVLLLGSFFIGSYVLSFFGVELAVVQVGGGIIVAALSWRLLNASPQDEAEGATTKPRPVPDAFYPLTMPLTIGPGAITVAIALGSHHFEGSGLAQTILLGGAATAGVLGLGFTIFLCYRFADRLVRLVGDDGAKVIVRLSAFIMFCIGIEIFWTGWRELNHASS